MNCADEFVAAGINTAADTGTGAAAADIAETVASVAVGIAAEIAAAEIVDVDGVADDAVAVVGAKN